MRVYSLFITTFTTKKKKNTPTNFTKRKENKRDYNNNKYNVKLLCLMNDIMQNGDLLLLNRHLT